MTTETAGSGRVVEAASLPGGAPGALVRACTGWLALRGEADVEARDRGADGLLMLLRQHLRAEGVGALRVVDVGAGTGANRAYLEPRLPLAQEWVAVDHDADLLAEAGHGDALRVEAGVHDLPDVLAGLGRRSRGTGLLLTCAALLDVLDETELGRLADAIEGAGGPALLSLSVTGRVVWTPRDARDGVLRRAFDAHQQRARRPGPAASVVLREELRGRGLTVLTARTPWVLDARRPELLGRWLDERVEAAVEQDPEDAETLLGWAARRRTQLGAGRLVVRVDHEDLLVLPRHPRETYD